MEDGWVYTFALLTCTLAHFFFPGQLAVFQKNPYAQFEVSTSQGPFPIHSLRYLPPPCVCKRFNWKDVWLSQLHKVPDRYQESDLLSVSSFLRFPTSIPWKHGILPLLGNMEWRVWFSRQCELEWVTDFCSQSTSQISEWNSVKISGDLI